MPTSRQPVERSVGANQIASSATKIGTDELATAATPESTCVSPQAISVNGIAALIAPSTRPGRHAATTARRPYVAPANAATSGAATSSRISTSTAGERSRTPTLMNRYDDPQSAAHAMRRNG